MGRTRTAKSLAQRIDLGYFKRPHPIRRWRGILSVVVPLTAVVWLGALAVARGRVPYSSGPLAPAHRVFAGKCERCHVRQRGAFSAHVSDNACVTCHDAPVHADNQVFTPECASCHRDHRGDARLTATADASCVQCHGALMTTDGRLNVAAAVGSFSTGAHPQFAVRRSPKPDASALRLNHAVHLKEGLRGPGGAVTLQCSSCHSAGRGRLMAPVTFKEHCASCHPLYFDPLIDAQAPHDTVEIVRAFIGASLHSFIAAHPEQIGRPDPLRGRIAENFPPPSPRATVARTASEWIAARAERADQWMASKVCAECHVKAGTPRPPGGAWAIAPTSVPARWMPRAQFDHRPHRLATCATCHAGAAASTQTADVLMPSIETCRTCHTGPNGADGRCFECHKYHDWSRAVPALRGFDLPQLTR